MNFENYMRNDTNLFNPENGYNLGNMFIDLYDPYKNYKPAKLKASNKKEELYLQLSRVSFAMHEMNLYLDVYPDDVQAIGLYNQYKEEADRLEKEYESRYGKICVGINENYNWDWVKSPWPWERI